MNHLPRQTFQSVTGQRFTCFQVLLSLDGFPSELFFDLLNLAERRPRRAMVSKCAPKAQILFISLFLRDRIWQCGTPKGIFTRIVFCIWVIPKSEKTIRNIRLGLAPDRFQNEFWHLIQSTECLLTICCYAMMCRWSSSKYFWSAAGFQNVGLLVSSGILWMWWFSILLQLWTLITFHGFSSVP